MIINVHFNFTPVGAILPSVRVVSSMREDWFSSRQFNPPVSSSVFIKAEALMKMYREQGSTGIAFVPDTIFSSAPLLQKSLELTAVGFLIQNLKFKIQN